MIPVSQPFLPPKDEYDHMIAKLWDSKWLTNNGEFVKELEKELKRYLGLSSLHFVSNGTIALQLAIKALEIKNEIITTPFSFVATTTSILWENCQPVFVDIDPHTLCMDPNRIEDAITSNTTAILATHVYGIPCDVEKIEKIAKKYNLKVIYDAAHAFGVQYKGRSLLSYGDLSTLSFHATKLFHTVEGGAVINNGNCNWDQSIKLLRSFGFENEEYIMAGINGKNSEFHAAMGLCNLRYVDEQIKRRKDLTELYHELLGEHFKRPSIPMDTIYNYSYYPIILKNEDELLKIQYRLKKQKIETRRYFYPSLNRLPYVIRNATCPISEDISQKILCLPLYSQLEMEDVKKITDIMMKKEAVSTI
ncbi:dTDP-4-amino-4,6-dideoxygalactose transaminase [Cytobacillus eiseniae]|uniref:dTDP-4-amino-4,6-dideoxygalactose transaminase n=1 Tax=Cytobacillus eiseniae TaxID=762947 RepID=A0ABS4RHL8_9BACI|nr:DegT/DnrJ/EryC1/StrS family aminotransferase [Cytobacillus eiseniae]MBP2241860.1 dTDP-4-amino-4,6-dideoxygalactose transaminase [Cytobacillus eiseniae]